MAINKAYSALEELHITLHSESSGREVGTASTESRSTDTDSAGAGPSPPAQP
jgi:hypothetical protein